MLALLALLACPADAPAPDADPCTTCVIGEQNQFSYSAELSIPSLPLGDGADAEIRWSDLRYDVHGHPFDPAAVNAAYLVVFRGLAPAEVLEGIEADTLRQADVTAYLSCTPTDDACRLSEFGNMGNTVHVEESFHVQSGTWLVVLTSTAERGAVAVAFLEPTANAGNLAAMGEPSARAVVDVDFTSLAPLRPRAATPDTLLDWSTLDRDGLGLPLDDADATELFLGRYDEPRAELEGSLFDLAEAAEESWTMSLRGSAWANLGGLRGDTPFTGVSNGSTWLAAVLSDNGLVVTPKVVTFLDPVANP